MTLAQKLLLLNLAASVLNLATWKYTGDDYPLFFSGLCLGCALMGWATSDREPLQGP